MIANDGIKRPLFIVDAVVNDDYEVLEKFYPGYEEVQLQGEALEKLQLIMSKVMSEGTGREIGALATETAGKTGTAQASLRGQPLLHAWFTGYYPLDQPKYAITVFVQNGGSGGRVAVPIFKEIVEEMRALGY
jgi:peptidoglycan glycosyltransferase/penicillin-binding protein 2